MSPSDPRSPAAPEWQAYDFATVTRPRALIVGITSPSGAGKTYSACRLAMGMIRRLGGRAVIVDTDAGRALDYKPYFPDMQWVPFEPPFHPARFGSALDYCIDKLKATVVIFDSMSDEHNGEGGVLDMIEDDIQERMRKAGNGAKEEKFKWTAQIKPKRDRRHLNQKIARRAAEVAIICCYRAEDKTKPGNRGEAVHIGWQAETTSRLPYAMSVRFLLPPGSDGHPNLNPDTEFEKLSIKMPRPFRAMFQHGLQLTEDLGEQLARWKMGEDDPRANTPEVAAGHRPAARPARAAAAPAPASGDGGPAKAEFVDQWLERFKKGGVDVLRILAKLGRPARSALTVGDLKAFATWTAEIKAGKTTLDQVFPELTPEDEDEAARRAAEPTAAELAALAAEDQGPPSDDDDPGFTTDPDEER